MPLETSCETATSIISSLTLLHAIHGSPLLLCVETVPSRHMT